MSQTNDRKAGDPQHTCRVNGCVAHVSLGLFYIGKKVGRLTEGFDF